jgi:hypothetical protein
MKPFHLRLHSTCDHLWLTLGVFTTIRSNFNYFGHFYNYETTPKNLILSNGWLLNLFSSINRLICPINYNSHQINHILKVFYGDLGLYFYVCIKIVFDMLHIFKYETWYFSSENYIWILKIDISILIIFFQFWKKNWIWSFKYEFFEILIIYIYMFESKLYF